MTTTTTTLDLNAIKARSDAATPGPWQPDGPHWWEQSDCTDVVSSGEARDAVAIMPRERDCDTARRTPNARFIAHAREDVPALVAEVERLREENARLREQAAASKVSEDILQANINALVAERDAFSSDCATSLADLQIYMRDMTARHGFSRDPYAQMTLLVEEVGELARVVKRVARGQLDATDYACREEFADVLITLAGLGNLLGVDLAEAFEAKKSVNASRTWDLGTEKETV